MKTISPSGTTPYTLRHAMRLQRQQRAYSHS